MFGVKDYALGLRLGLRANGSCTKIRRIADKGVGWALGLGDVYVKDCNGFMQCSYI